MIPHIPPQRQFVSNVAKPFNDLVSYIEGDKEQAQGKELQTRPLQDSMFSDLLNYATSETDKNTKAEKCIAIRTHGVRSIETASREMNAVALHNTRCKDPAYHFILSWPEHEKPAPDAIFDAAEHALRALGLAEHQYVVAIHGNTDNMHCHVSVNRVHPKTYKSQHLEFPIKNLHQAARESEIKHAWTHDNGIYIVETNGHGKKTVVLNKDYAASNLGNGEKAHKAYAGDTILPTWHDPDSLESWLKTEVAKALKHALPALDGWYALHTWLAQHGITLADSGGGGMRLQATSPETGEILDIAASKGLRLLKRAQLEKNWGPFISDVAVECLTPDFKHLSPAQLEKGINHVLTDDPGANRPPTAILARTPDLGRPPDHVLRPEHHSERDASEGGGGLHELPTGRLDAQGQNGPVLLQDSVPSGVGNNQAGQDQTVRRPGATETGSRSERSLRRDDEKRSERKEQRAAARADLRNRFAKYKRFVQSGDVAHYLRVKDTKAIKSQALKDIRDKRHAAKAAIPKSKSFEERLLTIVAIDAESLRQKLQIESQFEEKRKSLQATRTPPLSWRAWLYEQANLADQAALSALRGIVYQAQRDAKKDDKDKDEEEADAADLREQQFRKAMARLLEEEKKEAAIRSANFNKMRPHETDAILASYFGIKWRVTGNGNVEYSALSGDHLFTDRGNRLTFDRVKVTDHDIRLAFVHAQHKFGNRLTLTGDDPVFTARMARLADDMGIIILNPELQLEITAHREAREQQAVDIATIVQADTPALPHIDPPEARLRPSAAHKDHFKVEPVTIKPSATEKQTTEPVQIESEPTDRQEPPEIKTPYERLQEIVLSIDPHATFVKADPANSPYPYIGPVAATLEQQGQATETGFAQHTGRSIYTLHPTNAPTDHADANIEVRYRNGQAIVSMPDKDKGKGRAD